MKYVVRVCGLFAGVLLFLRPGLLIADPGGETEKPFGLEKREPWTTAKIVGTPDPPSRYRFGRVYPKLKIEGPVFLVEEPGTRRLLYAEHKGKIYGFPSDDPDADTPELFLEIKRSIYAFNLHPKYEENGFVFVFQSGSRVSRYQASLDHPRRCDPGSEVVIIEWPSGGHNGGEAIFGADGYLYISTGDGTSGSDVQETGQGVDDLLAVMMRLDVDHPDPGRGYSIPKDNPFIDHPGARPEIWAFGFRNPWRLSVDPQSGRIWVGDVGQDLWEMIWLVERGGNYGWSVQEGSHPFFPNRETGPGPILPPVIEHHHIECRSITGGYVYQGDKFPELTGAYVYGDYEYGKFWALKYDGKKVTWREELVDTALRPSTFAMTSAGEILTFDWPTGEIHALQRAPVESQKSSFPRKLGETGLFASVAEQRPAPGVLSYSVNAPAWADGATAERFVALPGTSQIQFLEQSSDAKTWGFENGTVTVQTLSVCTQEGNPASRRRIETRIVLKQENHWLGYTYLWNDEQTDAELVGARGKDLTLTIKDPGAPKGTREQEWHVPGRSECMVCHSRAAGFVLGLNTAQMNRDHDYGGVVDNQLRAFDHAGIFTEALEKRPEEYASYPSPHDETADLNDRVKAYLHVNCSVCHVNDGGGNDKMRLRYETKPEERSLVDAPPIHYTFGLDGAKIVASGDPYASILLYRMSTLGTARMPRAGSRRPDDRALALMEKWITSLAEDPTAANPTRDSLRPEEIAALERIRENGGARSEAIAELLASTRGALILSRMILRESLARDVGEEVIAAAIVNPSANVRDLFERFLPPGERIKRLGGDIRAEEILALKGDAERGRQLFAKGVATQCTSCHRIRDVGKAMGPDLNEIGKKYPREGILESILYPSRQVEPNFQALAVITVTGDVLIGIVVERSSEAVVLRDTAGEVHRLPRTEIAAIESQTKSLMPDLLLRDWTAQQAADVVEYLSTLKGGESG